jgi:hypothetical protein
VGFHPFLPRPGSLHFHILHCNGFFQGCAVAQW